MANGIRTGDNKPAFSKVLYVTGKSTDQWFIPNNNNEGDNPDSGTMANRLADCKVLVGATDSTDVSGTQIGKAVQPNTLADW